MAKRSFFSRAKPGRTSPENTVVIQELMRVQQYAAIRRAFESRTYVRGSTTTPRGPPNPESASSLSATMVVIRFPSISHGS